MARSKTITVQGMDKLARRLDALAPAILDGVRKGVRGETAELADDMRRNAPRGNPPTKPVTLVEGIQEEISNGGLTGTVAATARHSVFVEHGTEDTPEQPFAGPAAERSRRRFPDRIRDAVGGELKDLVQ